MIFRPLIGKFEDGTSLISCLVFFIMAMLPVQYAGSPLGVALGGQTETSPNQKTLLTKVVRHVSGVTMVLVFTPGTPNRLGPKQLCVSA